MRIGFDAKRAYFNESGLGNYSRNLIRGIAGFFPEHEIFLYSPKERKASDPFADQNVQLKTPEGFINKSLSSVWRSLKLGKTMANDHLDIYHGLSNELPADIKKAGTKSVVTIHDLIFLKHPEWYSSADVEIYKRKFKFACDNADLVVATSKRTMHDVIDAYQVADNKLTVVYQSCNTDFYHTLSAAEIDEYTSPYKLPSNYILYVGALAERKNIAHLIQAVSYIDDVHLVLVGNGKPAYRKQLETHIQSKNLENRIHLLTQVPDEALPALYQKADLFVYPSFYEGFGIPVLEAFCSNTPVITSSGTSMEEFAGDAALLVNPHSIDELVANIQIALDDESLRDNLMKRGSLIAERHTEQAFAKQMLDAYQSIL